MLKLNSDENIQKILFPMNSILEEKNIVKGVTYIEENDKLYICIEKDCLSKTNQLILQKIAQVYSNTIFYSDNEKSPNSDRLKYWCPDKDYDKKYQITEKCNSKKLIVLQLDIKDYFTILGTTIMYANALQEQDPMNLKTNEEELIIDSDLVNRHEHYINSDYPDLKWISLTVTLNKTNPLNENQYAPLISICEMNNPISCDNVILSALTGYNIKTYVTFNMDKEELEKVINEYFEKNIHNNHNLTIEDFKKKVLTTK